MKPSPDTKVSCSFKEVSEDALNDTQSPTVIRFPALQSKSESSVASVLWKCWTECQRQDTMLVSFSFTCLIIEKNTVLPHYFRKNLSCWIYLIPYPTEVHENICVSTNSCKFKLKACSTFTSACWRYANVVGSLKQYIKTLEDIVKYWWERYDLY